MIRFTVDEHYKNGGLTMEIRTTDDRSMLALADLADRMMALAAGTLDAEVSFTEPESQQELPLEPAQEEEPEVYDRTEKSEEKKKFFRVTAAKLAQFKDKTGVDDEKLAKQWIKEAEGDANKAAAAYLAKYPTPEVEEIAEHVEAQVTYDQLCTALTAKAAAMTDFLGAFQSHLMGHYGKSTVNSLDPSAYQTVHTWIEEYSE